MVDEPKKKMHPLGCLAIFVVVAAVVVGIGMMFGKREEEQKTPCQRYAKTVARALDNCHSGVNRSHRHHIAICEKGVTATDECLAAIEALECDALERGPAISAGDVCLK